jgi:hypothetical protein
LVSFEIWCESSGGGFIFNSVCNSVLQIIGT